MLYNIVTAISLTLFLLPVIVAFYYFRRFDKALKIYAFCIAFDFLVEVVASYQAYHIHNNLAVYENGSIISTMLISVYFNYSIRKFTPYHIGYYLLVLTAILGVFKSIMLHYVHVTEDYFGYYQVLLIISLSGIQLFEQLHKSAERPAPRRPHFKIALLMIAFWTISFVYWGLNDHIFPQLTGNVAKWFFMNTMAFVCAINNLILSFIFFSCFNKQASWRTNP